MIKRIPAGPNPEKNGGYTEVQVGCEWYVRNAPRLMAEECNSEERIYLVTRHYLPPHRDKTDTKRVCERHLPLAWAQWDVENAELLVNQQ